MIDRKPITDGARFGKWTVLSRVPNSGRNPKWFCRCDCGETREVFSSNLRKNQVGCLACRASFHRTHGLSHTVVDYLYLAAKHRAKAQGIRFSLKHQDIVIPNVCPLLGIPIRRGVKKQCANSPSLDRINSRKGYTPDNVWVISYRANSIKQTATADELIAIGSNLRRYLNLQAAAKALGSNITKGCVKDEIRKVRSRWHEENRICSGASKRCNRIRPVRNSQTRLRHSRCSERRYRA